jgi:hypothetical protein
MKGVVEHYRAFRVQPPDCAECAYLELGTEDEVPAGFEEMRLGPKFISQCPEHNKPLYQWLHKADIGSVARWLVKRGNRTKNGVLVFEKVIDELRKDLCV